MKTNRFFIPTAAIALFLMTAQPHQAIATTGLQVVSGKPASPFAFLRTHRQGKGVAAVWSVASLDGIVGFTVQRTYEDPTDSYAYWEDRATIPYSASRSFTHADKDVFPGVISYRIVAFLTDGTTVTSDVSQVRIVSHK